MANIKKQGGRSKGLLLAAGDLTHDVDYRHWIGELKARYRAAQIKASIAVNSALIEFYWGPGKNISEKYPGKKLSKYGVNSAWIGGARNSAAARWNVRRESVGRPGDEALTFRQNREFSKHWNSETQE